MSDLYVDGYCALVAKDNGEYRLPIGEFDRAVAAWKRGEAFFECRGLNGEERHVKLGAIESISRWSPDAIASSEGPALIRKPDPRRVG